MTKEVQESKGGNDGEDVSESLDRIKGGDDGRITWGGNGEGVGSLKTYGTYA